MTAPLAYVDTETTSLHPETGEIWEVGLILDPPMPETDYRARPARVNAANRPGHYVWQLPVDLARADLIALNIGGFHERRWSAGRLTPLSHFAVAFSHLTWGRHLVGAVPGFDAQRLERLLRDQGEIAAWHYHLIDVVALMVGFIAGRRQVWGMEGDHIGTPPWKSTEMSRAVGVDPDDERFQPKHSAIADALWAKAIWTAVMGAQ